MERETLLNMESHMLVSLLNLKLRDFYSTLDAYCDDIGIERSELEEKLTNAGYCYNSEINQFR